MIINLIHCLVSKSEIPGSWQSADAKVKLFPCCLQVWQTDSLQPLRTILAVWSLAKASSVFPEVQERCSPRM